MRRQARKLKIGLASSKNLVAQLLTYVPNNRLTLVGLRVLGIRIGRGCAIHHGVQWRGCANVSIGSDVFIAELVTLDGRGRLGVGDSVSINSGVQIWTAQHDFRSPEFAYVTEPVSIGDHAWICSRAIILPGVTIGRGAVVAAGAVVTKDVAPWTVVAGNPARQVADRPIVDGYRLDAAANKVWFL